MSSEWAKFKNRVKTKRTKSKQPSGEEHVIQEESLVVQRLSAGVSGKAQKYTRVGAREFVAFPYTEVTIGNIKEACNKQFSDSVGRGFVCDILASDQGTSCHAVSQIPDFKVIHVRFIEDVPVVVDVDRPRPSKITKMHSDHSGSINSTGSSNESDRPTSRPIGTTKSKFIPKSLSAVEMMKLGKVITKTKTSKQIQVSEFLIDGMCWSSPIVVNFDIASEAFGEGGFRLAYKANSNEPKFCEKTWVLKRYNQKTVKEIGELNQTVEQHTRKQVQMHCLARNITGKLQEELSVLDGFGETFKYNKIYLGLIEENDYVTIEEFIPETFSKYINNDGCVCEENEKELIDKAQCTLVHSVIKSEKELAIVDIQGCGYFLCDPEIASRTIFEKEEHLFTTGNLSEYSINNFIENHVCNSFCKILWLDLL